MEGLVAHVLVWSLKGHNTLREKYNGGSVWWARKADWGQIMKEFRQDAKESGYFSDCSKVSVELTKVW